MFSIGWPDVHLSCVHNYEPSLVQFCGRYEFAEICLWDVCDCRTRNNVNRNICWSFETHNLFGFVSLMWLRHKTRWIRGPAWLPDPFFVVDSYRQNEIYQFSPASDLIHQECNFYLKFFQRLSRSVIFTSTSQSYNTPQSIKQGCLNNSNKL